MDGYADRDVNESNKQKEYSLWKCAVLYCMAVVVFFIALHVWGNAFDFIDLDQTVEWGILVGLLSLATGIVEEVLAAHRMQDLAVAALERRWREYRQFELETARRKAYNYLARRGFTYEQARAAFDYIAHKEANGGND